LRRDLVGRELVDPTLARRSQAVSQPFVIRKMAESLSQGIDVAHGVEQSVDAICDDLARATCVGGDDWHAGGHCFIYDLTEWLRDQRRMGEYVEAGVFLRYIIDKPHKIYALRDAELKGQES